MATVYYLLAMKLILTWIFLVCQVGKLYDGRSWVSNRSGEQITDSIRVDPAMVIIFFALHEKITIL